MKIAKLETFLTNSGLRNYLFVRLTTDTGLTGLGEASLEWQEKTVQTLIDEWVEERVLGMDPYDVKENSAKLIRDQYQGGCTIMTAISSVEIAMWDILGKAEGKPIYELLGGKVRDQLRSYANGWYGKARTPEDFALKAREVVERGYSAMKFDPFETAWQTMTSAEMDKAEQIVEAVRRQVGEKVDLMIEVHGRLNLETALEMAKRLEKFHPAFYEEPVASLALDDLLAVKESISFPVAGGERLYTLEEFEHICRMGAIDVLQLDPSHCGGLWVSKQASEIANQKNIIVSPHCSIGPVALCAALHFDWATPNVEIQENFSEYDVPWRTGYVKGWSPIEKGTFYLPEKPGLGIELDEAVCLAHPYQKASFPSLWDRKWIDEFTKKDEMI